MTFVTLNTIINDILLASRGAVLSASEPISRKQVEDWIHQYRAVLLKRDMDKGKIPNPDFIQELPFISLQTDFNDSSLLVSVPAIPKTINFNYKSGFTYIGTTDGDEIQYVPEGRNKWQDYKKYTSNTPIVFLKNKRLYIRNAPADLQYITVKGIFEVPSEAARFINPNTQLPYFNADSPYPVPNDLLPALKEMILSKELRIEITSPSDTKTDSSHGLSENTEK
jgi:hypothetical protein